MSVDLKKAYSKLFCSLRMLIAITTNHDEVVWNIKLASRTLLAGLLVEIYSFAFFQ